MYKTVGSYLLKRSDTHEGRLGVGGFGFFKYNTSLKQINQVNLANHQSLSCVI